MATSIYDVPQPSKEKHPRQRSINISDLFLTRFTAPWSRPPSLPAYAWRAWVANQPVAISYRETLIANLLSLDWKITPRDGTYKRELDPAIRYYTKLLNDGGNYLGTDYSGLVEWIAGDVLDLPFGGAAEIGHRDDSPGGRVMWIRPLDAGTLYPTLNQDFPVVQYYQGFEAVVFPAHAIARTYLSPQQYIYREGWGMAPPEKAYFAVQLLNSGDKYYANLLLDVPTAGILDLGDMEKDSAEEWVAAFKTFVADQSVSFRVPVLYEHNNKVEFIPFGKVPNDIMYDAITLRYAALLGACYGMSTHDIGLTGGTGGETLAGTIRSERQSRRNGFAKLKAKMKHFFDKILPDTLEFNYIDTDEEKIVAMGRARLATATAMNLFQDNGNVTQQEVRSQIIKDGLFDIAMPDKLPRGAKEKQEARFWHQIKAEEERKNPQNKDSQKENPTEPEAVGAPKKPSTGGEGDIKKLASLTITPKKLEPVVRSIVSEVAPKIIETAMIANDDDLYVVRSLIGDSLFEDDAYGIQKILETLVSGKSLVTIKADKLENELSELIGAEKAKSAAKDLVSNIRKGINSFIASSIAYVVMDEVYTEENVYRSFDVSYDDILSTVLERINKSLPQFLDVFVQEELSKIVEA